MKYINYLFITMLLSLVGIPMQAEIVNVEDHFFCGFDNQEEFNQWTTKDLNGSGNEGASVFGWDAETKSALIDGHRKGTDDWIFSPAITISGNKTYAIKARIFGSRDKISFTMGSAATIEEQTIILSENVVYEDEAYVKIPLPKDIKAGQYHFGVHTTAGRYEGYFQIYSFELTEDKGSSLEVTVKNKENQALMENVEVKLEGKPGSFYEDFIYKKAKNGKYAYENLNLGNYLVTATLDGYFTVNNEIEIKEGVNTLTVEMARIPMSTVSGKVIDENGAPIQGATINLKGILIYDTKTNELGEFKFEKIRQSDVPYMLTIKKELKVSHRAEVIINSEQTDLKSITLKNYMGTPMNLCADLTEKGMFLSWMMPLGEKEFAHDNGVFGGRMQQNAPYSYAGVTFNEPMILNSMSWVVNNVDDKMVDVYVFLINKDGSYATKPIYAKKQVPTQNYDYEDIIRWNTHFFPEPIIAPYGCVVAVAHEKNITICSDYQGNSWHSVLSTGDGTQWKANDQASNFFIRANGESMSGDLSQPGAAQCMRLSSMKSIHKAATNQVENQNFAFTLYRFEAKDKENQAAWKEIGKDIKDMYFIDSKFNKLPAGEYYYAIQAKYENGTQTDTTYSKLVEHKIYTKVTTNIFTNTAINFAKGTTVKLTNLADDRFVYTATAESGVLVFDKIRKGKYIATATKEGFRVGQTGELVLDRDDAYNVNIEMQLQPMAPFNFTAVQTEGTTDVTLSWNKTEGIYDDFEAMEDFAINPAGELGWTYLDVDGGKTYGVKQCEATPYPNMFEPKAFMAFNPTATTPNIIEYVQPHSGDKMMVSVALETGGANDDYMFSPELKFERDFVMSFYACAGFYGVFGNEKFMVGYTTNEAKPENVTWLTKEVESVGGLWTKFTYRMPKEARHTVIRCVSNQCMFFMVDDVFIGQEEPEVFAMTTFNVFIDEEPAGTTNEKSITLKNIGEGKHIAKVQAVYAMADMSKQYSDFTELIFTVKEAVGMEQKEVKILYTYDAEAGVITLGDNTERVEIYNVQGKRCTSCIAGETIQTQTLQAGVYVLKIHAEGETSFAKILVK